MVAAAVPVIFPMLIMAAVAMGGGCGGMLDGVGGGEGA